jgi:hypothetical protein
MERSRADRAIAQAISGNKHAPQGAAFSFRHVQLVFYINRAGKNLEADQKHILEQAKDELRALYGKGRRRPG